MSLIVFGGGGFLGRAVVARARAKGLGVTVAPRSVDVARAESLEAWPETPSVVVNLAAKLPGAEVADQLAVNALGAFHVARWAASRGARHLVQVSTLSVVGRPWPSPLTERAPTSPTGPVTSYAASKLAGELLALEALRAAGGTCTCLRLSALYGPGMPWTGVLATFVDRARAGQGLVAAEGVSADFLYVDDAADLVLAAAQTRHHGVLNGASGVETSLVELGRLVLGCCGRPTAALERATAPASSARVDIELTSQVLGVRPRVELAAGLRALLEDRA